MGSQAFDHPAYSRQVEQTPPWLRIRVVVACAPLGETPGWQDLRGRFAGLLMQESIRGLIWRLTDIPDGARWRPRATYRRSWLEADMTVEDQSAVPAASAMLFLPEKEHLAGLPPGCAQFNLHIDLGPELRADVPARGFRPPYWRERFAQALALPGDLAGWLETQLGLATTSNPAAQAGIMIQARQPLSELIDVSGIQALPGAAVHNQFTGWAAADTGGQTIPQLAAEMMLDLSERILHLDGSPDHMAGQA
jgi:hypothetical protein